MTFQWYTFVSAVIIQHVAVVYQHTTLTCSDSHLAAPVGLKVR